jgi:hypothetical protein
MGESSSYRAVCGEASTVQGVCLLDCSTTGCDAGFRCDQGACVPAAVSVPDGGAPQFATIERQSFFVASDYFDEGTDRIYGQCIGAALAGQLDDESRCTVIHLPAEPGGCDCAADGLETPEPGVLANAISMQPLDGECGRPPNVPCEVGCGCQVPAFDGVALEACRNEADPTLSAGFCLVPSNSAVSDCPADQAALLRIVSPTRDGRFIISCSTKVTVDIPAPQSAGALGASCTPSAEYRNDFSSYYSGYVDVDTGTPECASGTCLVYDFQGRTDCTYGQPEPPATGVKVCTTPGASEPVSTRVPPQAVNRPPGAAVYCSCQCDGSGPGPFCECPSGFSCEPVAKHASGSVDSYCVKEGTLPDYNHPGASCQVPPRPREQGGCGDP